MPKPDHHSLEHHTMKLGQDQEGWDFAMCECGWISPPCPGVEEASGFWSDHLGLSLIDGDGRVEEVGEDG